MGDVVLLGAGASMDAGIPGAFDMTRQIANRFEKLNPRLKHVLNFVMGGLLFDAGQRNNNPLECGINVEALFNAIQLLGERHTLEASPFIGSWHHQIDEFDKEQRRGLFSSRDITKEIYKTVADQLCDALDHYPAFDSRRIDEAARRFIQDAMRSYDPRRAFSSSHASGIGDAVEKYLQSVSNKWRREIRNASPHSNIGEKLERLIEDGKDRPGGGEVFKTVNNSMIAMLRDIVLIKDRSKVDYLRPLVRCPSVAAIVSLNYDNAIELACESEQIACETGIDEWSNDGTLPPIGQPNVTSLLKLHGSIDWVMENVKPEEDRPLAGRRYRRATVTEVESGKYYPALIFGQRNKLTADGPFLDLFAAFRESLAKAATLTVVGYSFGDDHINAYIAQWLNADSSRVMRIINGKRFPEGGTDFGRKLARIAERSPHRIQLFKKYAAEGIDDVFVRGVVVL